MRPTPGPLSRRLSALNDQQRHRRRSLLRVAYVCADWAPLPAFWYLLPSRRAMSRAPRATGLRLKADRYRKRRERMPRGLTAEESIMAESAMTVARRDRAEGPVIEIRR